MPREFEEAQYLVVREEYTGIPCEERKIGMNPFWLELARHIMAKDLHKDPFLSPNFIHARTSVNEILFVLAFSSLPFEAQSVKKIPSKDHSVEIQAQ
mmetsp:Transcript_22245/g.19085  ORF Transcript_22245/g.19085 Transcript_22245/m.19085 type:complete len:97 (-) Transcript_22245:944-1234(-)